MADINRTNSPMNLYREDCLETKEELDEARERLIQQQSKTAPFLVGSIDRVNERIANLDKELDSFSTSLVVESRNSNVEDDYAYLTPQYQHLPEKAKDSKERTQFAGVYAVKSTLLADASATKTKHLTRFEPKKATKEKPTTKPKLVELHQYPGYDATRLTPLPGTDPLVILRLVADAQEDLARKPHYRLEFKRLFNSKMSEAVLVDTFWWFFLQRYHPSRVLQEKIFNRVAHNYVKLMLFAKHPKYRDVFLKAYPDLLSQSVYSSFCAAFPNSWRQFDDKFKSDLCTLTHQWIVGTRPMPNLWENWNISMLEPKDMRKEVLMKKDPKKKGLLNLDFTSAQEPGSSSTSQIGINIKGTNKTKSVSRSDSNASMSTVSFGINPLDSDINSIAAVAQAQNVNGSSKSNQKRPPVTMAGKSSNLQPINEVLSEASTPTSNSDTSKVSPVKKLERTKTENRKKDGKGTGAKPVGEKEERATEDVATKSRNLSNVSVARMSSVIGLKNNGRKKTESHPAGSGPDFTKVAFNVFGRSPLVQHFLRKKGLDKTAGMDVFYQRTEIDKLPSADIPTYREIIQDSFNSVRLMDENYKQMHEDGIREHTQFLTKQRQKLKEHMRRENTLMSQPREVKRLSDLLVLELLKDHDEVSTGAALAVEEALLAQDET